MIWDFGKLTSFERGTPLTKLLIFLILINVVICVPNVPCGVESFEKELYDALDQLVPNVPCGVES